MRALSIRQPYAELILRGIKTAEVRSVATRIVGERFYIYAARGKAKRPIWSDDLSVAVLPAWLVELAEQVKLIEPGAVLPAGVIVGSAVIDGVEKVAGCELIVAGGDGEKRPPSSGSSPVTSNPQRSTLYRWHLRDVRRLVTPIRPTSHPQPVWFEPF